MENTNNDQSELKLSSSGDSKSDTWTLVSVDEVMNNNSGNEDTGEGSRKDSVILPDNGDDPGLHNENRVAVDCKWLDRKLAALIHPKDDKIVELTELLERVIKEMDNDEQDEKYPIDKNKQYSLHNTRALLKESTTYELETFDRHALVIFNQKIVDGEEPRLGTEKDVGSLTRTFYNFGFEVSLHNDLTKDVFFEKLKEFSERDFTYYGCVAVAILTHGSDNGLLCAKDRRYREIDVINLFINKPTLVSKPKIFIIQACRGDEASSGVPVLRKDSDAKHLEPYYFLPLESDLLILHSSYPGRASHRHILDGSWFIQTLCKKIDSLALTHDLESIMTEVKRTVAIDMDNNVDNKTTLETNVDKQMPVMTSTLIRKLYLKKFEERALEECRELKNKVLEETNVEKSIRRTGSRNKFLDEIFVNKDPPVGSWFIPKICKKIHSLSLTHDLVSNMAQMVERGLALYTQNNVYSENTLKTNIMTSTSIGRTLEESRGSRYAVREDTYVEKPIRRTGSRIISLIGTFANWSLNGLQHKNHLK